MNNGYDLLILFAGSFSGRREYSRAMNKINPINRVAQLLALVRKIESCR